MLRYNRSCNYTHSTLNTYGLILSPLTEYHTQNNAENISK